MFFSSFSNIYPQSKPKGISGVAEVSTNPKKFAIIIGINDYREGSIGDLKKAENDAKGLSRILLKYGNFDKIKTIIREGNGENITKYSIMEAFDSFLNEMNPYDTLLFYFSGHGMSDYDEKNYLLVNDTKIDSLIGTSIALEELVQKARAKKIKKAIFLIDACRNPDKSSQLSGPKFLQDTSFNDVEFFAVLFSTKLGYYSYEDDESAYGIFTKFIIYGLEGRADLNFNAEVTMSELSEYVINSLKEWSSKNKKNQKPYLKLYGEKSDDIIITNASNPEISLADLKINDPYATKYILKNAIFPGWGHYDRGQKDRGRFYLYTSTFLYTAVAYSYWDYRKSYSEYNSQFFLPPSIFYQDSIILNELNIKGYRESYLRSVENLENTINLHIFYIFLNFLDFALFKSNEEEVGFSRTNSIDFKISNQKYHEVNQAKEDVYYFSANKKFH